MDPIDYRRQRASTLAAIRRYARAEQANAETCIADYQAGICTETPQWAAANAELTAARAALPRRLRWLAPVISSHVLRKLDYRRRTGQA